MASNDWTLATDSLTSADVARGVSAGVTPPSAGSTFCYVMNALTNTPGCVALYASPQSPNTNFNPMLKGGEITGACQRGVGGGNEGMSAFLYIGLQGTSVGDEAYILGLSDGDPSHLELRKGIISAGLPDAAADALGTNHILSRSTASFAPGDWVQLKLEVTYNDNGDVVIQVFQNDLSANDVTAPVWEAIAGMDQFIDDLAGINSGSLPLVGGRAGFGGTFSDSVRRAYFDQIEVFKQL